MYNIIADVIAVALLIPVYISDITVMWNLSKVRVTVNQVPAKNTGT
jgi:hypothetical protein